MTIESDQLGALRQQAQTYFSRDKPAKALDIIWSISRMQPLGTYEYRLSSLCYLDLGMTGKSLQYASRAVEMSHEQMPDFAYALQCRGLALLRNGKKKSGMADLTKSLLLLEEAGADSAMRAEAIYYIALGHQERGRYRTAIRTINEAMKLVDPSAKFFESRAYCYCLLIQYDSALQNYAEALKLEPGNASLWASRGTCHNLQEAFSDARDDLDKAIELDAEFEFAFICRAESYIGLSAWGAALSDLQEYLHLHGDDGTPSVELAEAYEFMAKCHKSLGNHEAAAAARASAFANDPDNIFAAEAEEDADDTE